MKFTVWLQHFVPQHTLSRLAGWFADRQAGALTTYAIKAFIKRYQVNMDEAQNSDPASYRSFNEFFTRPLVEGARPIDENALLVSPADGVVSENGAIVQGRAIQAKGHDFSVRELLGGFDSDYAPFADGEFCTVYLSPRDYHRVHMPIAGTLTRMVYVPGRLYSVNPTTAANIQNLFAINERLVCFFDTATGPLALVFVGATIVGSMETVWQGVVTPPHGQDRCAWDYSNAETLTFAKGEEIGRFRLGSTVILVRPKNSQGNFELPANTPIQLGQPLIPA